MALACIAWATGCEAPSGERPADAPGSATSGAIDSDTGTTAGGTRPGHGGPLEGNAGECASGGCESGGGSSGANTGAEADTGADAGADATSTGDPWMPVDTSWCADAGWVGLDDHTCFYRPPTVSSPAKLLFFLHGMMPPDASTASQQSLVRAAADSRGFVAVFPRGWQGLCDWDPSVTDRWCWPTSRANVDAHAGAFVREWTAVKAQVEKIAALTFEQTYVLGFSNGGYFASYHGLESWFPVDGAGVVAAGRSAVDESLLPAEAVPFYIAVGELDSAEVINSAANLAFVLNNHKWPVKYVLHAQRGHEVRTDDVEAAFDRWTKAP